jgi:DNA-3-methyladenine glycosylase
MPRPLPRSFYIRDTLTVARDLIGRVLARRIDGSLILRGRIVETEAYVGEEDQACHARAGRTRRTDVMYGESGHAYIYFTYGMHFMLNVVTEPPGSPAAVLIRAVEPLQGVEWMANARRAHAPHALASGPGKLCQAFGLTLEQNRTDLLGPLLWIEPGESVEDRHVRTSARIGCQNAASPWDSIPWRFYVARSPFVTPGRPVRDASSPERRRSRNSGVAKARPAGE